MFPLVVFLPGKNRILAGRVWPQLATDPLHLFQPIALATEEKTVFELGTIMPTSDDDN